MGLSPDDFKDAKGNLLPLKDIMDKINDHSKNFSSSDRLDLFHAMFGTTGQEAGLILSKNAKELGHLNDRISDSQKQGKDGYIGNIAERNMNTAQAQINRLKQAGTALASSYAVMVLPVVSGLAKQASNFTTSLTNASPFIKTVVGTLASAIPVMTVASFALSGIAKAISGTKSTINGIRTAFSWLTGNYKKQESEIDRQVKAYEDLTAAIKINTKAKQVNSDVDLTDDISGGSSGSSKGSKSKSGKTTAGKLGKEGKTLEKEVTKDGKSLSKLGKGSNLNKVTRGAGMAGMAIGGLSIGSDLMKGSSNTGQDVGAAVGGSLGMLIPIPVVDIAASAALGYAGGKAGDWVQKNAKVTQNGEPYKPEKHTYTNGVDTSTSDKLLGKRPSNYDVNDENSFNRAVQEDEERRRNKNNKNNPVEWSDFEKSQSKNSRKFTYDTLGGSDSNFLKKWVKDENDATMSWATTTGKSTKAIKESYDKLIADATNYTKVKNKQEKDDLDTLVKRGIISKDEANNTLQTEKDSSEKRLNTVKDTIEKIKNIDLNGGKGRQEELEKLNKQLLSMTDKGTKDQKLILQQLNSDTSKISREREAELINSSRKAKDETIKNANKQYTETVKGAESTYQDTVKRIKGQTHWSQKQKDDAIQNATDQYVKTTTKAESQKTDTVHWANVQYDKVVSKAQDQANDVANAINSISTSLGDLENGTKGVTGAASSFVGAMSNATPDLDNALINQSKFGRSGKNYSYVPNNKDDIKKNWVDSQPTVKKNNKEKNSTGFGDFSPFKSYNAFALGGRSARDEIALMNEDGEESIYNRKKGTFNVVQGRAGLVKLNSGDEVLDADQTKAILNNNPKRGKSNKAYAKGSNNSINIRFDATGVKTATSETKKAMQKLNSVLEKEYKRATQQSKKLLKNFREFSSNNWDKIGDETSKSSKVMSDSTNKNYKFMNSIVSKSTKDMKDVVGSDTKSLVSDYNKVMSKLPDYASDSMKKVALNLNKGISGINTSLEEFGGNKEVLKPIKYATGSNGKLVNDQLAMINDSPTDQKQEAVIRNDKVYMPKGENRLLKLQTGDQVLNGKQTAKLMSSLGISRYAGGSGVSDGLLKKIAKKNSKNPNDAYANDFNAKVKIDGSDLGKSITKAILGSMKSLGQNWTKSMWNLIQDTIDGGGSGSKGAFLRYAEKIGTGKPYVYGGFDCSKLIQDSLKHFGIDIGRDTVSQSGSGKLNSLGKNLKNAEVGDLAYYGSSGANAHVGIISDKDKRLMMNQHPPKGGISSLDTGLPLNGYFSVKGLTSNNGKKGNNQLNDLVKNQLGKSAIDWISNQLGQKSDGGGVPQASGNHKNWLKQAGISPNDYGYASEIATKESSWNPRARNGQYYGIAQTTVDNYKKYGGPNWEYDPVGQLVTMRKYVENRYGNFENAIGFRRQHDWYENGGMSTKHKMAEISEGNKPEMVIPLTNKSRSVELILKSLEFMFGDGSKGSNNKKSSDSNADLIKALTKSNEEKDKKIDNILDKMDILISSIQNKPVISEADIYKANKRQTQNQQRFNNLGKGAF